MQLYLIRHPAPAIAAGICYGASDIALAEDAANAVARVLPRLPPLAPVFSSPLRRCAELAAHLHVAPVIDERLGEISFGDWELQAWDEIGAAEIDAWAADPLGFTPPNGESPRALLGRALDWLDTLLEADLSTAVAVTHAGIIRVLAGHLQGLPEADWLDLRFRYASVSAFEVRHTNPGGGRMIFLDR